MKNQGFYHPDRGYWQATGPMDMTTTYPEGTIKVPQRPGPEYEWSGSGWAKGKSKKRLADSVNKDRGQQDMEKELKAHAENVSRLSKKFAEQCRNISAQDVKFTEIHKAMTARDKKISSLELSLQKANKLVDETRSQMDKLQKTTKDFETKVQGIETYSAKAAASVKNLQTQCSACHSETQSVIASIKKRMANHGAIVADVASLEKSVQKTYQDLSGMQKTVEPVKIADIKMSGKELASRLCRFGITPPDTMPKTVTIDDPAVAAMGVPLATLNLIFKG